MSAAWANNKADLDELLECSRSRVYENFLEEEFLVAVVQGDLMPGGK